MIHSSYVGYLDPNQILELDPNLFGGMTLGLVTGAAFTNGQLSLITDQYAPYSSVPPSAIAIVGANCMLPYQTVQAFPLFQGGQHVAYLAVMK